MVRKKSLLFRKRLYTLLKGIEEYPITVLVASTGYGKTTVVKQYLEKTTTQSLYIDITSSEDSLLWQKLGEAVTRIVPALGHMLNLIGVPSDDLKIAGVIAAMKKQLTEPLILVVDDCQLLPASSKLFRLFAVLAVEDIPALHLVLLSQRVPPIKLDTLIFKDQCLFLERETLAFDLEETQGYLEQRGMSLAKEAVVDIYRQSGGWVSVLFFISEAFRHGHLDYRIKSLNQMFEESFLWIFTNEERQMLIRLAALDQFTIELAIAATENKKIGKVLTQLEKNNAFLTEDETGWYRFHTLLQNYLKQQCPENAAQKQFYLRAGYWYLQKQKYDQALQLYWQAGRLEQFLQEVESRGCWSKACLWLLPKIVPDILDLAWTRYPSSFLQISFALLRLGRNDAGQLGYRILKRLETWSEKSKRKTARRIQGDCILIQSFLGLYGDNDWNKHFYRAQEVFQGEHSLVLLPSVPITFGMPMFLYLEYRQSGTLAKAVEEDMACPLENMIPGFGHGMDKVIQAEAALVHCRMDEAEHFATQALVAARSQHQYFLEICAWFTLLRRALFIGDYISAIEQLEHIRVTASQALEYWQYASENEYRQAVEYSEVFLYVALRRMDKVPEIYLNTIGVPQHVMGGMGLYDLLRAKCAYVLGNMSIAIAECDCVLGLKEQQVQHSQLIRLGALILKSKAEQRLLNERQALLLLSTALQEAAPDEIYLPFVEDATAILPLMMKLKSGYRIPQGYLRHLKELCRQQMKKTVNWQQPSQRTNLSKREVEALQLAARGLNQNQIAVEMQVQTVTVKKHLINAYAKLGAPNKVAALRLAKVQKLL